MPYSIMMDAGHGGRDPGAVYNGRRESDDNLRLALAVGEILQDNGIQVEYTRTTDIYETPYQKAMEANEAGVDLFISIHRNSFPTDNVVSGVESLVYDLSGLKLQIAESINAQLEAIGFVNLGVTARPNLVVLKRTKMPAVLVEVGFINSDTDNQLFDDNFDVIAQAIASGILDVLEANHLISEEYSGVLNPQNSSNPQNMPNAQNMPNPEHSGYMPVNYRVQVGAFRNRMYAERLRNELMELDFPAFIDDSGEYLRVQVGGFDNLEEAAMMERRLKREGYQTVIVSE